MASEKCPKCGTAMWQRHPNMPFSCPLDPKACRISELESLLRASAARERELQATNARLLQDRLDYSNVSCKEGMNSSEWIWRTGKAERERDAALDQVAVLGGLCAKAGRFAHASALMDDPEAVELVQAIKTALSNTSATAQRVREDIEREAQRPWRETIDKIWLETSCRSIHEKGQGCELCTRNVEAIQKMCAAILGSQTEKTEESL